ncbi:MAG: hypothetical protein G8D58_06845 [gamma proteobacterium symbiont of Phacoides pectinatus]
MLRDESGAITGILSSGEDITEQRRGQRQLRSALENTIQAIARTVEKRAPYTAGHQQRVAELAAAIAREMRMDEERIQVCRYLVKDFGTSQSPKSTRQRDSRYCPDRPALITTPSRTLQQSCSCATPS